MYEGDVRQCVQSLMDCSSLDFEVRFEIHCMRRNNSIQENIKGFSDEKHCKIARHKPQRKGFFPLVFFSSYIFLSFKTAIT